MGISRYLETLSIAYGQILSNKVRTFLTAIGITIGVAAVVVLLSVGQGVERFVIGEFEELGSNIVLLFSIPTDSGGGIPEPGRQNFGAELSQGDVDLLTDSRVISNVQDVAYSLSITESVSYNDKDTDPTVEGISANYMDLMQLDVSSGRSIDQNDIDRRERVAVIGAELVDDLFDGENPIGESIRVGSVNLRVVGVMGESTSVFVDSDAVFMPVSTAQTRLGGGRTEDGDYPLSRFFFFADDNADVDVIVDEIDTALRTDRDLDPADDVDYLVFAQSSFTDTLTVITGTLTIFLGFIAGISLVVGGIGIMNIMMVTVTERTREIGLRKALGAQKIDILLQFMVEAIGIALLGGLVGTAIAIFTSELITLFVPDFDISVQMSSILLAVLVSTAVGGFFGVFPANRAASMSPIDALRYE